MESERELLQLAAKAAGLEVWTDADGNLYTGVPEHRWNPVVDDGDALRLARAANLRIDFNFRTGSDKRLGVGVWTPNDDCHYPPFWTMYGTRPDADVRWTILRAAAFTLKVKAK